MLNKKSLIGIVTVVVISLFMNFGNVTNAATTNASSDNSSLNSSSSSSKDSSMTSSENDAYVNSLEKGATMRDPSFTDDSSSNDMNDAHTYSKANKTKTVTNANNTSCSYVNKWHIFF